MTLPPVKKPLDSAGQKNSPFQPPKVYSQPYPSQSTQVSLLQRTNGTKRRPYFKYAIFLILGILAVMGALTINRAADLSQKIFAGQTTSFFGRVWETLRGISGNVSLAGENQGQINVLLLGIGGPGHEGPYLTDTMILAQIRPKTSEVAFVSVPRDTLAQLPNNLGERKINSIFSEGYTRTKDWNEAGRWARQAVERLSGQTIPYFAVIDFHGFEKAVDEVGGVEIDVERSFDDFSFPIEGKENAPIEADRYEHLHFDAGKTLMDGNTALKYARSRHAAGPEGSDFARSLRQQKVIKALKDKILDLNLLGDSGKINKLLGIFADNFHTNISPGEIFHLYDLAKEHNIQTFLSLSLDPETGLLCATSHETAGYILIPCSGKTSADIQNYFKNAFVLGKLKEEKSVVWLASSVSDETAYKRAQGLLTEGGLTVWPLEFSKDQFPQTIFYQANPKPATAEYIKNVFGAKEVTLPPPGVKIDSSRVDVIVILGKSN
jgi:LCP family protein required for cell wall assembly